MARGPIRPAGVQQKLGNGVFCGKLGTLNADGPACISSPAIGPWYVLQKHDVPGGAEFGGRAHVPNCVAQYDWATAERPNRDSYTSMVGHQPEGTTRGELHVGDFYPSPPPSDKDILATPVKLERFAVIECERHEGTALRPSIACLLPVAHKR